MFIIIDLVVNEIYKLSQEEGLNDREISEKIGCSRATVNRIRIRKGIPTADLSNRRDKTYFCLSCGKKVFIRRKERRKLYCEICSSKGKV